MESVIVSKDVKIDELIVGDKNALLIATRILGYGKDYEFMLNNKPETVDLSTLDNKEFDTTGLTQGVNEFSFTLPHSNQEITYKILTGKDEKAVERELAGIKRIKKDASPELSTRLKHLIVSVDGKSEKKDVRDFVDNYLLARDSRALREHIKNTQPDVDLNVVLDSGEEVRIPIGLSFFWPDA